ncbi:hypothetical protein RB213_016194, partial [Colletotrichum asianum]
LQLSIRNDLATVPASTQAPGRQARHWQFNPTLSQKQEPLGLPSSACVAVPRGLNKNRSSRFHPSCSSDGNCEYYFQRLFGINAIRQGIARPTLDTSHRSLSTRLPLLILSTCMLR